MAMSIRLNYDCIGGMGELDFATQPVFSDMQKVVLLKLEALESRDRAIHLREDSTTGLAGVGELFTMPKVFHKKAHTAVSFDRAASAAQKAMVRRKLTSAADFARASIRAAKLALSPVAEKIAETKCAATRCILEISFENSLTLLLQRLLKSLVRIF